MLRVASVEMTVSLFLQSKLINSKFCFNKRLDNVMVCHDCGETLERLITNLPFKIGRDAIVIIKGLPVLQCRNCNEYVLEDEVMQKLDHILSQIDNTAELEVLSYAV